MKKKKITFYFAALFCAIMLYPDEVQGQQECRLMKDTIRLDIGQSDSVKVKVKPATDTVAWKSKNPLIAKVQYAVSDSTWGKITALQAGETKIVVTSESGEKDSCVVIVYDPVTKVELLDKNGMPVETLTVAIGSKDTLYAKVSPTGAKKKVIYSSLSGIATINTVDTMGIIDTRARGTVKIVVSAGQDNLKTDTCLVIIDNPVTEVSFENQKDTIPMRMSSTMILNAMVKPVDADNKTLRWSVEGTSVSVVPASDNPTAAIVTSGLTPGNSKITAISSNGKMATCIIKVLPPKPVSGLSLNKDTLYMTVGDRNTLISRITPADAFNKKVLWESSNEAFASVASVLDTTGIVTAKKIGVALIIAKSEDGGFKDTCYVNVQAAKPVTGIIIDSLSISLSIGKKDTLNATIKPANATNKKVMWTTSDSTIVTVDSCVVKAVAPGEAWVYVQTADGGYKDSCKVSVHKPNAISNVENADVWAFDNSIRIHTDRPTQVYIYTVSGMLYRKENAVVGERIIVLPKGVYIVVMDDVRKKVFVQ